VKKQMPVCDALGHSRNETTTMKLMKSVQAS